MILLLMLVTSAQYDDYQCSPEFENIIFSGVENQIVVLDRHSCWKHHLVATDPTMIVAMQSARWIELCNTEIEEALFVLTITNS